MMKDLGKAESEAETAITLDVNDGDAHFVLAKIYARERKMHRSSAQDSIQTGDEKWAASAGYRVYRI
jgi:Tfp pilus assembly protein PilF